MAEDPSADEFAVIARCFAPLATEPGARALRDDAAVLEASGPLVITTDAIVEGVHFLPEDPIETVAQKALRVNLSDLAAKGAAPLAYLLTLAWARARPAREIEAFAMGLQADQATYGLTLLGGDTVSTPGPLMISVSMLGRPLGPTPARSGARAGHELFVTGEIGDGALGLAAATGRLAGASAEDRAALIERYRRPRPRTSLAAAVARFAAASMDVSDGLLADAAKLAEASGVAIEIEAAAVPLSEAAGRVLASGEPLAAVGELCAGGDDYEILLAIDSADAGALTAAARAAGVRLSRIGRCRPGAGVRLLAPDGSALAPTRRGFAHRLGA